MRSDATGVLLKLLSKIAAFVLFGVLTISAGVAMPYLPCQPTPPACHEHNHPEPAQKTPDHECCVTARTPALPMHFTRLDTSCRSVAMVRVQPAFALRSLEQIPVSSYRSETPPGISQLRI
jgi:hypothetical protein